MDNPLLDNIKDSIQGMQSQMKDTYARMAETMVTGVSHDESVKVKLTATYELVDIDMGEGALEGGLREFKYRMREAWKDACEKVQKATQQNTLELLQSMKIPDEIKNISADEAREDSERDA